MSLLPLFCILLLLSSSQAEDIMFFADDYYKSLGRPALAASAVNPVLLPGEGTLQINLANLGRLEELIPIEQSGPARDIHLEMKEEMRGGHALAVNAALIGSGGIAVSSGPERIDDIAPGDNAILDYNVTVMKNASGWSRLALEISYQQQADVSVKSGEVFPLYEAAKDNLSLDVFVAGEGQPLSILGSPPSRNLFRGHSLKAVISNDGQDDLHNCSARLLAAPPFSALGREEILGDLPAGSLALADFNLRIDGEAKQQDYQMSCRICCQERCSSLPLTVSWQPGLLQGKGLPSLAILGLVGLGAIALKRVDLLRRDKRRRGPRSRIER
ncbi:MAG TPA: hypothetical protein PKY20_02490 [Methanothrix sp.]|nr:hypothetical protein [Methanothrix sp.]HQE97041.1 hypothetical protein [Methanothrix sp.]HQJ79979.1 hypothetical protein [Methanothrix sp.]